MYPVVVRVIQGGPIYIEPVAFNKEIPDNWMDEFPSLRNKCFLEEDKKGLVIEDQNICESHESISKYLHKILHNDLIYGSGNSAWYLIREVENHPLFPRAAYYYLAVFILGSIVRYEPELMLEVSRFNSEISWFIDRFLKKAERFFPQLKLSEQFGTTIYF